MSEMIRITKFCKEKEDKQALMRIEKWLNSRGIYTERRWKHGNSWLALYRERLPTDSKTFLKAFRE